MSPNKFKTSQHCISTTLDPWLDGGASSVATIPTVRSVHKSANPSPIIRGLPFWSKNHDFMHCHFL